MLPEVIVVRLNEATLIAPDFGFQARLHDAPESGEGYVVLRIDGISLGQTPNPARAAAIRWLY